MEPYKFSKSLSSNTISILKEVGFPVKNIEMIISYPKGTEYDKMTHQIYDNKTKII